MRRAKSGSPLLVAVGGGKGGVGKSVVAANLAVAIGKLGARVVALDADLGSANLHTLFGIDRPEGTLQALIEGRATSLGSLAMQSGQLNVRVVPGSVAVPGAANLQHARKLKLIRHLRELDADVVVIDCGAGIHYNVLDFFAASDVHITVASAQLTSLQNAYGFLKAATYRALRHEASALNRSERLDQASDGSETETVPTMLARVAQADPELYQRLCDALSAMRVWLVGNQVSSEREASSLQALSRMVRDFLNLNAPVVGRLRRLDRIHDSVTQRRPFLTMERGDAESQCLLELAESLLRVAAGGSDHVRPSDDPTSSVRPKTTSTDSSAPPLGGRFSLGPLRPN